MSHWVRPHPLSECMIKLSALPDMLKEEATVAAEIGGRMLFNALLQASTDRPIRGIHSGATDTIAVFLEKGTHAIALLGRRALLEERIAKQACEMLVRGNEGFV